jgi:hypothetical protein
MISSSDQNSNKYRGIGLFFKKVSDESSSGSSTTNSKPFSCEKYGVSRISSVSKRELWSRI